MKAFVILSCLCAVAYGQFGVQTPFGSASIGSSRFQNQNSGRQNARPQGLANQRVSSQPITAANDQLSSICNELNERHPVPGSCDRYIECINGTAEEKLCPDGLRYNPDLRFNVYPCQYPNEYSCLERSSLQPPQPTEACPHQFGIFKIGDERNCSSFRNCVNGVGFDFTCPDGLAFSSQSYRCEWPDEVEDCDTEAFLGFRCPEVPVSRELGAPVGYRFYRSEDDCQKYFMCINERPRLLRCGGDSAFDYLSSTCVSADEVSECPEELRIAARTAREEEQQRLAKQLEFEAKGGKPGVSDGRASTQYVGSRLRSHLGAAVGVPTSACTQRNYYYKVDSNCDSYVECKDFVAHVMMCPDGLHYDPSAVWPAYPCAYPSDVSCEGRGAPQPAQSTAECPHQYGFFPSPLATPSDCGQYRMCVEGRAIEMVCPPGLAFNPETARCDWPELVPTCNADAYLGFKCPPTPLGDDGMPLDVVLNYRFEGNCYAFYSCQNGNARLLTCDAGYAFDPVSGRCEDADKVPCKY